MSEKLIGIDTVALTPFSEFKKKTVLIGANCMPDANSCPSDIADRIINPYRTHDDVIRATEFCWNVSLDCCDELGDMLNQIHGLSYNKSYWMAVILPWMIAFVENVYDRYLRLCWVRDHCPDATIEIPHVENKNVFYGSSFDVCEEAHLHAPNVRIYSFLIDRMGLRTRIKYVDAKSKNMVEEPTSETLLQVLKRLYRMINFHYGNAVFLWHSEKPQNLFKIAKKSGWIQWGVPLLKENRFSTKSLDRDKLILKPVGEEFKDILRDMIRVALPISLFEKFNERRQAALSFIKRKNIKTVFMAANFWTNDTDRILAAEVKAKGGKIVGIQHGGGYGQHFIIISERVERLIYNYFITWGWKDKGQCPTIPLPSPYLSRLANTHVKKNNDILFIGSQGPTYMFRYIGYWMPEYVYFKHYSLKESFLKSLQEHVKSRILYKPYPLEYGWNEKERIRKILPQVRFLDSGLAVSGMKGCSLVVIDHPTTSFIEALQINVPTILYWDDTQCPMRLEARYYFQLLVEAGILYYDPVKAAENVNEISRNPGIWWKSEKVQLARKEFCRVLGLADPMWSEAWSAALKNTVA